MNKTKTLKVVVYHHAYKKNPLTEKLILEVIPSDYEAAKKAYFYALDILKKRWPKGEHKILNCPYFSYLYSKNVIKKPWPEAEPIISKDARSSYYYARYVLKGPFLLAEKNKNAGTIFNPKGWDMQFSYSYARHISKSRLRPRVEREMSVSYYAGDYAKFVVKGRWKIGEGNMIKSKGYADNIQKYMSVLSDKDKAEVHNRIILEAMQEPPPIKSWEPMSSAKEYLKKLEVAKAKEELAKSNVSQNDSAQSLQTSSR